MFCPPPILALVLLAGTSIIIGPPGGLSAGFQNVAKPPGDNYPTLSTRAEFQQEERMHQPLAPAIVEERTCGRLLSGELLGRPCSGLFCLGLWPNARPAGAHGRALESKSDRHVPGLVSFGMPKTAAFPPWARPPLPPPLRRISRLEHGTARIQQPVFGLEPGVRTDTPGLARLLSPDLLVGDASVPSASVQVYSGPKSTSAKVYKRPKPKSSAFSSAERPFLSAHGGEGFLQEGPGTIFRVCGRSTQGIIEPGTSRFHANGETVVRRERAAGVMCTNRHRAAQGPVHTRPRRAGIAPAARRV